MLSVIIIVRVVPIFGSVKTQKLNVKSEKVKN